MAGSDHAFVPRKVKAQSLRYRGGNNMVTGSMIDVTAEMDHGYEDVQGDIHTVVESHLESEENATEVVWFPFDLPNSLVKEIIWESGGNLVTSVLYGTPAAGNGVQACLEMGCSVLSLCENEHHMEHLTKTLQSKLVQCASKSNQTFGSDHLALRARPCAPEVLVQVKKSVKDIKEKQ